MNLEQFLDVVEKKRTLVANLENINYGESREVFADGPPCLQNYVSVGKVDNNRNIFLSQCARTVRQSTPITGRTLLKRSIKDTVPHHFPQVSW